MKFKVYIESIGFSNLNESFFAIPPFNGCYINNENDIKNVYIENESWWEVEFNSIEELIDAIKKYKIDIQFAIDIYFDEYHIIILDQSYHGCTGHRCI